MTREEAADNVRKIKNYMCAGNPMWDTRTIEQTLDMAIKALEQPTVLPDHLREPTINDDLISRQATIDVVDSWLYDSTDNRSPSEVLKAVPSAQQEPIRINLNELIKVKLTDWGKEIYYHQYDRTNQIAGREICKPKFPKEDEDGYTEFQLWCFIELYGDHMGMTLPNVIKPLEIVYGR